MSEPAGHPAAAHFDGSRYADKDGSNCRTLRVSVELRRNRMRTERRTATVCYCVKRTTSTPGPTKELPEEE